MATRLVVAGRRWLAELFRGSPAVQSVGKQTERERDRVLGDEKEAFRSLNSFCLLVRRHTGLT